MISDMDLILRMPWEPVSGASAAKMESELTKELLPNHPLFGVKATALARRADNDDVLFALASGASPYAVVHLTWTGHADADPRCPATVFYPTAQAFSLRDA